MRKWNVKKDMAYLIVSLNIVIISKESYLEVKEENTKKINTYNQSIKGDYNAASNYIFYCL